MFWSCGVVLTNACRKGMLHMNEIDSSEGQKELIN